MSRLPIASRGQAVAVVAFHGVPVAAVIFLSFVQFMDNERPSQVERGHA